MQAGNTVSGPLPLHHVSGLRLCTPAHAWSRCTFRGRVSPSHLGQVKGGVGTSSAVQIRSSSRVGAPERREVLSAATGSTTTKDRSETLWGPTHQTMQTLSAESTCSRNCYMRTGKPAGATPRGTLRFRMGPGTVLRGTRQAQGACVQSSRAKGKHTGGFEMHPKGPQTGLEPGPGPGGCPSGMAEPALTRVPKGSSVLVQGNFSDVRFSPQPRVHPTYVCSARKTGSAERFCLNSDAERYGPDSASGRRDFWAPEATPSRALGAQAHHSSCCPSPAVWGDSARMRFCFPSDKEGPGGGQRGPGRHTAGPGARSPCWEPGVKAEMPPVKAGG